MISLSMNSRLLCMLTQNMSFGYMLNISNLETQRQNNILYIPNIINICISIKFSQRKKIFKYILNT